MPKRAEQKRERGITATLPLYRSQRMPLQRPAAYLLVAILLLGATAAIYLSGGTGYAVLHCIYIPIIVAGSLLGIPGGVATGIIAGLLLGPFMPLDVARGEMQVVNGQLN